MHQSRTRRSLVTGLGLVLVLALLLSACGAPAASPSAPADEAAPAEGAAPSGEIGRAETLIYNSDTTDLITLDPAVVYEFGGTQIVGQIYETLLSYVPGQKGTTEPLLAESWEITDEGDMWNLTFALNPDAAFASGNPVTAEDVVFSWNRAMEINKSPAFLLTDVCAMTPENITAVDAQTL